MSKNTREWKELPRALGGRRAAAVIAALCAALCACILTMPRAAAEPVELPANPAVEWRTGANDPGEIFDGESTVVELPDAHTRYDAADGFALSVRVKPEGFTRLAGIVGQYESSRAGSWYLAQSGRAPHTGLSVVMIDAAPYPAGYRSFHSGNQLVQGQWHHLILNFDGEVMSLICDGELVGSARVEEPLLVPDGEPVQIGLRGRDHFEGAIRDLRIFDAPLDLDAIISGRNYMANSSFENGDSLAEPLSWHRMVGTDYLAPQSGWELDETEGWHGGRSLRGDGSVPLVLTREIWAAAPNPGPWTFSAYMKAAAEGVRVRLGVGAYWRLEEEIVDTVVELGTQWERHEFAVSGIPNLHRRGSREQGPMNFYIEALEDGPLWVDALQWEPGESAFSYNPESAAGKPSPVPAEIALRTFPSQRLDPVPPASPQTGGQAPIRVHHFGEAPAVASPVQLGVPFAEGVWNGLGRLRLTGPGGEEIPLQAEILSRWHGDNSIQSLGVYFLADLEPGSNTFTLGYSPEGPENALDTGPSILRRGDRSATAHVEAGSLRFELDGTNGLLWDQVIDSETGHPVLSAASIRAVGMDGAVFSSENARETRIEVEREGPLHVSIARRGMLTSANGEELLQFIARLHLWKGRPAAHVELTLANPRPEGSVALREVFWETRLDGGEVRRVRLPWETVDAGDSIGLLQYYDSTEGRFARAAVAGGQLRASRPGERDEVWLDALSGDTAWRLHALYGWQQHPTQVSAGGEGGLRGYLWPGAPVMGLEFGRGMSITREFILQASEATQEAAPAAAADVAFPDPALLAGSDLLMPFYQSDPERFPFMESVLTSGDLLGRLSPDEIESRRMYGLFDYGDNHGDGGWANLESFNDYAALFYGLRNGDAEAVSQGFASARHYRDVDIDQLHGNTITHNPNHIMGGTSLGHAWPEGVAAHYLLTGSRRSLEVALLHGRHLLEMPVDTNQLEAGTRTLGRFFLNLAHIYQLTGDPVFLDRFIAQLEHSVKVLEADPTNPDHSIFSLMTRWEHRRLVPYHAWYGCMAMMKMYRFSGDERILPHIHRDVRAALHPDLHDLDLEQLWPGLPPEAAMPIMTADFARHRGSFFYPVLMAYADITGERKWADLALSSLYAWALEGRSTGSVQAILSSAPLAAVPESVDEGTLIEKGRELLWNAAAPRLLNADFSGSREHWNHWRPFPGKSLAHHTNWQRSRQNMASLDFDTYKANPPAYRFDLSRGGFTERGSVDTARFQIEPGVHRLSGWVRVDDGARAPGLRLWVRPLDGRFHWLGFSFPDGNGATRPDVENPTDLEVLDAEIGAVGGDGWRSFSLRVRAPARAVGHLWLNTSLTAGHSAGHVWLDGFSLERVE